jgi:hypothetical protein
MNNKETIIKLINFLHLLTIKTPIKKLKNIYFLIYHKIILFLVKNVKYTSEDAQKELFKII